MRLVMLGLPGAGKGTQGMRIAAQYHIPHISTGRIIRGVIASGSELGREVNAYISKGDLVPDHLAMAIVRERLKRDDCKNGWILDGYPRTVKQAIRLDESLATEGGRVDLAFDVRISRKEAIERITQRRLCRQCGATYHLKYYRVRGKGLCDKCGGELYQRADDTREIAKQRLAVYMRASHPVAHYYAQDGRLYSIDGERSIAEVFKDILYILETADYRQKAEAVR